MDRKPHIAVILDENTSGDCTRLVGRRCWEVTASRPSLRRASSSSSGVVMETERLRLHPYKDGDLRALVTWAGDWEVASWLTNVPHLYSDELGRAWIAHVRQDHASGRPQSFAVALQDNDRLIGNCGLDGGLGGVHRDEHVALGYWFGRPHWGRGYAREAARAVVAYGFDVLKVDVIEATTHPDKVASQRVLLACDLIEVGEIELATPMRRGGRHCPLFRLTRQD